MLIQKDVKPQIAGNVRRESLRALLIQKDVKPSLWIIAQSDRLRALLIQKDVKQMNGLYNDAFV